MDELKEKYYLSRTSDLLALFDAHALAWKPFLARSYSDDLAGLILKGAREQHQALIPAIPYIGGDENPMTRHLVRSTTSLALYQAMKAHGKTARDAGQVIYAAVVASVSQLPPRPYTPPSPEFIAQEKELALKSQILLHTGQSAKDLSGRRPWPKGMRNATFGGTRVERRKKDGLHPFSNKRSTARLMQTGLAHHVELRGRLLPAARGTEAP